MKWFRKLVTPIESGQAFCPCCGAVLGGYIGTRLRCRCGNDQALAGSASQEQVDAFFAEENRKNDEAFCAFQSKVKLMSNEQLCLAGIRILLQEDYEAAQNRWRQQLTAEMKTREQNENT